MLQHDARAYIIPRGDELRDRQLQNGREPPLGAADYVDTTSPGALHLREVWEDNVQDEGPALQHDVCAYIITMGVWVDEMVLQDGRKAAIGFDHSHWCTTLGHLVHALGRAGKHKP